MIHSADRAQIAAAFVNELGEIHATDGAPVLELKTDLKLCSPAYIGERDARELRLLMELDRRTFTTQTNNIP